MNEYYKYDVKYSITYILNFEKSNLEFRSISIIDLSFK